MHTSRPEGGPRRSVLREVPFLRLWIGTTASGLATWSMPLILGLAVLEGSLDPAGLGVVLACQSLGFLAAVPVSGVVADRYSRRLVVWCAGLAAAVAVVVVAGGLGRSLALMAVAAVVAGAGQGACRPAFQALVAEIVDADQRQVANAAMTLAVRVTTLIAPTGAALLSAVLGVRVLLVGVVLLWLVAAVVPPRGRYRSDERDRSGAALLSEFADGVREARRHPWFLAGLGALSTVIATGYSATAVALPLVSRDRFGSEVLLASALTGYTLGALLGALVIARWRPRSQGWAALAGLGAYGCAPLALLLPVPLAVIVAAYVIIGMGIELFNVPWFTATQREIDPAVLGRVSSLDFLTSYGLAPLGLALIAPAIVAFGITPVLAVCAVLCFLAPATAALVPTARHFSRPKADAGTPV